MGERKGDRDSNEVAKRKGRPLIREPNSLHSMSSEFGYAGGKEEIVMRGGRCCFPLPEGEERGFKRPKEDW